MRELRLFLRSMGGMRRFGVLLMLRAPFDALHTIVTATFLQAGFNAIGGGDARALTVACALYGAYSALLFAYNGTVWTLFATAVARWVAVVRLKVYDHISRLPQKTLDEKPSGEWMTRLNADVLAAAAVFNQPIQLPHAVVSCVNIVVSSILIVRLNPVVYALIVAFVAAHMLISQLIIARPMTALATRAQQATAANATDLRALVDCADIGALYDAQGFLLERFERGSLALRAANMRMRRRAALGGALLPLMGMSGYFVLILVCAGWIASGDMRFGDLVAAFQYRGGVLLGSMMLTNCLMNLKATAAGAKRLNETMALEAEPEV